jgi:hypothetical protein
MYYSFYFWIFWVLYHLYINCFNIRSFLPLLFISCLALNALILESYFCILTVIMWKFSSMLGNQFPALSVLFSGDSEPKEGFSRTEQSLLATLFLVRDAVWRSKKLLLCCTEPSCLHPQQQWYREGSFSSTRDLQFFRASLVWIWCSLAIHTPTYW